MTKHGIKFLAGTGFMVLIGLGVLYALHFFSPEYRQEQAGRDLIRQQKKLFDQYQRDTYGAKRPEETLNLFIDALKKGDIDLAVKYFVLNKQDEWKKNLAKIKESGLLDKMIKDLQRKKYPHEIDPTFITYEIANDQNMGAETIYMKKTSNGLWKIERL